MTGQDIIKRSDMRRTRGEVINLSVVGDYDPTEELLIKRALKDGIIVVAAMGNGYHENNDASFPAALEGVIAVGASTEVDRRASFSQTGKHILLVAPGVNILARCRPTRPSSHPLPTMTPGREPPWRVPSSPQRWHYFSSESRRQHEIRSWERPRPVR